MNRVCVVCYVMLIVWISYRAADRQKKGWKYGAVLDETYKTHPGLIPFAVWKCHVVSCLVVSSLVLLFCLVLSCLVSSRHVMACLVLMCLGLVTSCCNVMSCYTN